MCVCGGGGGGGIILVFSDIMSSDSPVILVSEMGSILNGQHFLNENVNVGILKSIGPPPYGKGNQNRDLQHLFW